MAFNFYKDPVAQEKETFKKMIRLYCHSKHSGQSICSECRDLKDYAVKRLNGCKFGAEKPTCEKCPVHCYAPEMRDKVKTVMRYAGPRMLFVHPVDAIRHLIKNKKSRD